MKFSHFLALVLSFFALFGALVGPIGSFRAGADSTVNNGTEIQISGTASDLEISACIQTISSTFSIVPSEHLAALKTLVLDFNPAANRGLGGQSLIRIRCTGMPENELRSVFIHEIGHIVDTGLLDGHSETGESSFLDGLRSVFQDDPSLDFYTFNFSDSSSLTNIAKPQDFVSGYAQSDVFEDFSESYTYYILHGAKFRFLSRFHPVLRAKYAFLKDRVFDGREYGAERVEMTRVNARPFDVTKL
ncbi:hypothetical protein HZA41_02930 [Candidatus Peregrinibacteria bacterium]|nr:hypothetical protein [Candidatus Peregrinibacteria bacterium]